ncbi:histidinol dehydrogenase [bacterium BMS3Abin03]|nr:histidinol dehydrogenase [bacterium BMS3Abin03]
MKTYSFSKLSPKQISELTKRPAINFDQTFKIVKPIIDDVKSNGLEAALKYAKKFDGLISNKFRTAEKEILKVKTNLPPKIKRAIDSAYKNIRKFHLKQLPKSYKLESVHGINCSRELRAIENVGLYIPGGSAVLPSTMLMLGVPAQIAGCKRVVVCSPAKDGKVNDSLLYAAFKCGIKEFYKIGGAQAVALMAYGDESVPKASKIFGPGNQFVTAAKLLVSIDPEGCSIDMPAGPSELLIVADETANPAFVAADLLSQAEHGIDSQVVLVTTSIELAKNVEKEIKKQLKELPREKIATGSLNNSFALIIKKIEQGIEFSNLYAPEHLILNVRSPAKYKFKIKNAGSVFLGNYSPESAGDYASGTNHSLPTYGFAKSFSGATVESFMKSMTFQSLTKDGLKNISETVQTLAETEGLIAHRNAVKIRLS